MQAAEDTSTPKVRDLRWLLWSLYRTPERLRAFITDEELSIEIFATTLSTSDIISLLLERNPPSIIWDAIKDRETEARARELLAFHKTLVELLGSLKGSNRDVYFRTFQPQQELDEVIRVLRGDHLAFARLEKLVSNREIELNEKQQGLMWKLKNPEQRERFLNISAANPDAEKSTKFPTRKIGIALMVAVALIIFYVSRSAIYCLVFNYGHCPEQSKPEPPKPEPPKPEPPKPEPPKPEPPKPEPPKPEPLMPKPLRPKPQKFKRQKCSELWRQCNAQISRCAAWKKNCADAPSLTALPAPDDASAKIKSMLAELVTIQSIGSQDSRSLAPIQALPRMIRNVAAILRKGNRKDAIELCGKLITRFDGYMRKSSFSLSEEKTIEPSCEILMQVDHATIDVLLTACGKANYYYNKHKDALTAKCQQYQSVFPP